MGTILPCLLETDSEATDTKKLQKLLDKAAYSLQMWTKLSFISKAEFLAYTPSFSQGKFVKVVIPTVSGASSEGSSGTNTSGLLDNKTGRAYYSRSSTVEQRNQQTQKEGVEKRPKQAKEEKEAKQLGEMKDKIQALEAEKHSLKKLNNEIKAARQAEIDSAVSKAEAKNGSKVDQLSKQLN